MNKTLKKLYQSIKQKIIKTKQLKGANELFSDGKIFKAKSKELDNILKEVSTSNVPNETVGHKEIIRALVVLAIKNERYASSVHFFNV